MRTVALLLAEPGVGRLGHARSLDVELAGGPVWRHAAARAGAVAGVAEVVLVHPADRACPGEKAFAFDPALDPPAARFARRTARAWSPWAWRGGLGGATVWDELLPAGPLLAAAEAHGADAVLLAGADWPLLDPALAGRMLAAHAAEPEALPLVFSQAPPGLAPLVLSRAVLTRLAQEERDAAGKARGHPTRRGIAGLLAYQPERAQVDPIARDVNAAVPAAVRDMARRFVFDTPAGRTRLERLAAALGPRFSTADSEEVAAATLADEATPGEDSSRFASLPPLLHVELTTRRVSRGSATPPAAADRASMTDATLAALAAQSRGLAVTLGGLGDAALHRAWAKPSPPSARPARGRRGGDFAAGGGGRIRGPWRFGGGFGHGPRLESRRGRRPPERRDAAVYADANGADDFERVLAAFLKLVPNPSVGRLIPLLTRTTGNVADLEAFFERWWQLADHAVIDRFATGGTGRFALAADASPVPMDPPWTPPRPTQAKRRLTVLADGTPCLCHQDWRGRAALGGDPEASLAERWSRANLPAADPAWSPADSPLCRHCFDFLTLCRGNP